MKTLAIFEKSHDEIFERTSYDTPLQYKGYGPEIYNMEEEKNVLGADLCTSTAWLLKDYQERVTSTEYQNPFHCWILDEETGHYHFEGARLQGFSEKELEIIARKVQLL